MESPSLKRSVLPTLQYADSLSRYGVVVETQEDALTIRVPRAGWKRTGPLLPILVGAFLVCVLTFGSLVLGVGRYAVYVGITGAMAFMLFASTAVAILGAATAAGYETHFKLTQQTLAVTEIGTLSDQMPNGRRDWESPTAQIGNIKGDLYGMGLTIQVIGREIAEFLHGHPEAVRIGVATLLRGSLARFAANEQITPASV